MKFDDLKLFEFLYFNHARIGDIARHFSVNLSTAHRIVTKNNFQRKKIKKLSFEDILKEYKKT